MMETTHFRLPVGSGSLDNFKGLADLSEVLMDQHLYPDKPLKASLIEKYASRSSFRRHSS